jgi:hypothetical protein
MKTVEQRIEDKAWQWLRDHFAGQALAGGLEQGVEHDMASTLGSETDSWWHPPEKIARRAYAIANAMMKERKEWL